MTTTLVWFEGASDPRNMECGIHSNGGGTWFKLYVDGDEDPAIEGPDPDALEREARARGAIMVEHFYRG